MKTKIGILVLALCTIIFNVQAQNRMVTSTRAMSKEISNNLDLDAVASIFGDSENLEDFERRLNDPNNRISNLDLNEDGYIDYLRVVENSSERNSLVIIQAVLGDNDFQDVATIEVERVNNGNPRVQIVGEPYIYGSNYIIEPAFVRTPLIFSFFWGPHYSVWNSPYYWNNYPRWYSHHRPYSPFKYRRHIYARINFDNKYHHTDRRNIQFSGDNYNHIRRNDYAKKYPNRDFENRHQGINNRNELNERWSNRSENYHRNDEVQRSDHRIRPNSSNSEIQNQERKRPDNTNINRSENIDNQKQNRKEIRNESNNQRINSENKSGSTLEKSTSRDERRNKYQGVTDKIKNAEGPVRSKKEVRTKQRVERKSEPAKEEDKKESETGRRR